MPFRSRGKLLAELAALLGLWAAGAGCQSLPVCAPCAPVRTPPTATYTPRTEGPALASLQPPTTQEPALAQPCTTTCCTSAMLLRPVPVAAPLEAVPSTPVQRVSGETPVVSTEGGVSRIVTMERPQPAAFVPAARPEAESPGLPPPPSLSPEAARIGAAPLPAGEPVKINAAPPPAIKNSLPPPRMVPKPTAKPAAPSGYPELPGVVVTAPPEAPREFAKRALSDYIIEPPDVLSIDLSSSEGDENFPIRGGHLVRPDGTVGLGPVRAVFVAGMTLDQAKYRIAERLAEAYSEEKDRPKKFERLIKVLKVDVLAYNSKFYYVITDGGGYGEQVIRIPCTGNETVLDAVAQIQGLPAVASKKKIWVARATPTHVHEPNVLPVDWCAITQRGSAATNYQLYPGDRIYVNSDVRIRLDSNLAKILAPIERLLGVTLLGSTTVNSITRRGGN